MEEAEEGASNGVRKWSKGERGRKGDREGGKLQGRYPEEDTGQYTVYSAQNTAFAIASLVLQKYKIVNGYINSVL